MWPKECILKEILPVPQLQPTREVELDAGGQLREIQQRIYSNILIQFVYVFVCLFDCLLEFLENIYVICFYISVFFTYSS